MSEHGATVGTRRRSCADVAGRAALAGSYGADEDHDTSRTVVDFKLERIAP
jgi:hypothetical protein